MNNTKDIISRLRQVFNVANNKELSEKIGVNYHTLNIWINRDSIPYNKLYDIIQNENISFDWVISGKGNQYIKDVVCSDAITELEKIIGNDDKLYTYKKDISNIEDELIESFRVLPKEKQELYYYRIKADSIECSLSKN